MIEAGQKFPEFSLQNQDGKTKTLKDYAGKWLVLYVYPKDDTPGCTIEGQSFSAAKAEFEKQGIQVVGLSEDDVASHKSFCGKYSFTIDLLADTRHQLLKATDVPQVEYKGKMYWNRTTFIVDPKGSLRKVYAKVDPNGHEKVVLTDIAELKKTQR